MTQPHLNAILQTGWKTTFLRVQIQEIWPKNRIRILEIFRFFLLVGSSPGHTASYQSLLPIVQEVLFRISGLRLIFVVIWVLKLDLKSLKILSLQSWHPTPNRVKPKRWATKRTRLRLQRSSATAHFVWTNRRQSRLVQDARREPIVHHNAKKKIGLLKKMAKGTRLITRASE